MVCWKKRKSTFRRNCVTLLFLFGTILAYSFIFKPDRPLNGKKYFQGYTAHYVKVAVELTENDTKLEQNEVIVVDIQGFIDENLLYGKVSIEF